MGVGWSHDTDAETLGTGARSVVERSCCESSLNEFGASKKKSSSPMAAR